MMNIWQNEIQNRKCRTICLPFSSPLYNEIVSDAKKFRAHLDDMIEQFPELFPAKILNGYEMKDISRRKKLAIDIRRIKVDGTNYSIHPSFVMPYMTAMTEDAEDALFLRKFNVPFWALANVFGRDAGYWYRMEQTLGRFNLIGATVRNPEDLPKHLCADEKHTRILGQKAYIATTVAEECILGTSVALSPSEADLKTAYGGFKEEIRKVGSEYEPETVNTDGWEATKKAWKSLFPSVSVILCFLHLFIKMRDRGKKKYKEIFLEVSTKLWDCYRATDKPSFSQRVRRLHEWSEKVALPDIFFNGIKKLRKNIDWYKTAYDFNGAHRTSNMLDRLMQRMGSHLFSTQYFHGSVQSAENSIRGWALILNFAPLNPNTLRKHNDGFKSPAERFNRFSYHESWMHNLLISAFRGGYRVTPQNPE